MRTRKSMESRRVFIQLEVETTETLEVLRNKANWNWENLNVIQLHANVAQTRVGGMHRGKQKAKKS